MSNTQEKKKSVNQKCQVMYLETKKKLLHAGRGFNSWKWGENSVCTNWPQGGCDTAMNWTNVTLGWQNIHHRSDQAEHWWSVQCYSVRPCLGYFWHTVRNGSHSFPGKVNSDWTGIEKLRKEQRSCLRGVNRETWQTWHWQNYAPVGVLLLLTKSENCCRKTNSTKQPQKFRVTTAGWQCEWEGN